MAQLSQSILRGSLAEDPELDHTGALIVIDRATGERDWFCTATLIAPQTVVTAKHCATTVFDAELSGFDVAWLEGPSIAEPVEIIPLVALETTPPSRSGFLRIGRDVAVAQLEHATDIPFAEPQPLRDDQLGQTLFTIGYGVFDPSGAEDGQRRIGNATVAAVRGSAYPAMFRSFESYVEWNFTFDTTDFDYLSMFTPGDRLDEFVLAGLREDFGTVQLLDGYEAVAGGRQPGDSQTCIGDSGGPLALRADDGRWQTYGVVSASGQTLSSVCDFGTVFATFGPDTLAFLQAARAWQDPCGDVSAQGECRGSVAVRCETSLFEERRELVSLDCAESARECFLGTQGAECHEPSPSSTGNDAGSEPPIAADAGAPASADAGATEPAPSGDAEPNGDAGAADAGVVLPEPAPVLP